MAISKKLIREKSNVVVLARNEAALKKIQDEHPRQVRFVAGDMSDTSFAQTAVDLAIKEFGQLDGLIVNHGRGVWQLQLYSAKHILGGMDPVAKIEDAKLEEWRRLFDVNFFSAVAFVDHHKLSCVQTLTCIRPSLHCRAFDKVEAVFFLPLQEYRPELTALGALMGPPKQR